MPLLVGKITDCICQSGFFEFKSIATIFQSAVTNINLLFINIGFNSMFCFHLFFLFYNYDLLGLQLYQNCYY